MTSFELLVLPHDRMLASIIVALGSVVPVVLFKIDCSKQPPVPGEQLNAIGYAILAAMGLAILAGIVALYCLSLDSFGAEWLAPNRAKEPVQGAITALLSFLAIYMAQLLRLRPK